VGCHRLTHENAGSFARALGSLPDVSQGERTVIDLAGIRFLGSVAVAALLRLNRAVRLGGGRLTVVGLRPGPYQVLIVTRLTLVLDARPASDPKPERRCAEAPEAGDPVVCGPSGRFADWIGCATRS
jgi:anti-anti-sigma factor